MKVSLNFANQYSNVDIAKNGIDEVIQRVGAQLGAIEDVEYWNKKYQGAVVVRVVSCEQHPNADKLSVCMVDDGGKSANVERNNDGFVRVVCGAPNVTTGVLAVWLPPTTTVPATYGSNEPFVLDSRELRGVVSNGMLAAPDELGFDGGHEGLLLLQNCQPGESFATFYGLDDVVLDLENKMFTHRPDCFGVLGVARELAGIQGMAFKSPDWYIQEPNFTTLTSESLPFTIEAKTELVPRFMAVAMTGITVKPSPLNVQSALLLSGIRPINNVVDITNYLMQLTGQPLHVYDYDKLAKNSKNGAVSLVARPSVAGEKLNLLNGKEYILQDDQTVMIATNNVAVGVGGVMGGADTEVDDTTINIVIECASFDMYNIRKTAMKYGLFTDAVTRYNKGQSPLQNNRVIAQAIKMVAELTGGSLASDVKDVKDDTVQPMRSVTATQDFINVRLGSDLTTDQIATLLTNVEFIVHTQDDSIEVTIPFWRRDIEYAEDIVEEVGRLYGYDKLPVELPKRTAIAATKDVLLTFKSNLRAILTAAGANEILTYNFIHANLLKKVGQDVDQAFALSNALSPSLQHYRLSLTPNILEKINPNIRDGYTNFALFEIGKAHTNKWIGDDRLPIEAERLALVFAADKKAAQQYNGAPYYQARVFADELFSKLGVQVAYIPFSEASAAIVASEPIKPLLPSRSAIITNSQGDFIGAIGEYTKKAVDGLKLPEFCAGFELDITQLMATATQAGTRYTELPKFPSTTQDISFKVMANTSYTQVFNELNSSLHSHITNDVSLNVEPIDIYAQNDIKHITFRIKFANYTKTMQTADVNTLLDAVAADLQSSIGAVRI